MFSGRSLTLTEDGRVVNRFGEEFNIIQLFGYIVYFKVAWLISLMGFILMFVGFGLALFNQNFLWFGLSLFGTYSMLKFETYTKWWPINENDVKIWYNVKREIKY